MLSKARFDLCSAPDVVGYNTIADAILEVAISVIAPRLDRNAAFWQRGNLGLVGFLCSDVPVELLTKCVFYDVRFSQLLPHNLIKTGDL